MFITYSLSTPKRSCVHKFFAIGDQVEVDFTRINVNFQSPVDDKEIAEVTKTSCDVLYAKLKDGRLLGLRDCGTAIRLLKPTSLKVIRVPCYVEAYKDAQEKSLRYPFVVSFPGTKQ